MTRCVRTGQLIAEPFGLEVLPMDPFNDIDYGEWQGLTPDEARVRWPEEVDLWYRRPDLARIAGGETLQDVLARAARGLRAVVDRHPEETVVLVGHDSVNRVILLHALELALSLLAPWSGAVRDQPDRRHQRRLRRAVGQRDLAPSRALIAIGGVRSDRAASLADSRC